MAVSLRNLQEKMERDVIMDICELRVLGSGSEVFREFRICLEIRVVFRTGRFGWLGIATVLSALRKMTARRRTDVQRCLLGRSILGISRRRDLGGCLLCKTTAGTIPMSWLISDNPARLKPPIQT